jgi:predicted permease
MIVPTAASVDLAADAHNASVAAGVPSSDIEENLYPALVECFGIIFMGYVAGRFNIVSSAECKGMATFVSNFALPALVFGSLCRLDFSVVNWTFLLAIFIAKSALFFAVLLVALVALRPTDPARAGLYAIFTTQSNDFALGFPILTAIYGKTNPEFPMYLYLIAPINLVILNPIGFICMEVGNRRSDGHTAGVDVSNARHCFNVARSIASNPIIAMTLAGILGNFVFSSSPPALLEQFLSTMGSAFSASALFLLGVQIVGNRAVKR